MSAYIVGRMRILNRDWMDEYFSQVPALIEAHGGRFLVKGGEPGQLEGSDTLPDAAFILHFPDRASAEAFWHSDAFAPLIKLRQTGSELEAQLYSGV